MSAKQVRVIERRLAWVRYELLDGALRYNPRRYMALLRREARLEAIEREGGQP